jgi:glycyl-tRNA synthetase
MSASVCSSEEQQIVSVQQDQEYIRNYLTSNKIIFQTNQHDNVLSGFQNYGPIGLKIKTNIINTWRKIFIEKNDNIFEIDAPIILNESVLDRSGHIKKFNDLGIIFYDKETKNMLHVKRADHFIEDMVQSMGLSDILYEDNEIFVMKFLNEHKLIEPNIYVEIKQMSLMFQISSANANLYLRPEIAQTIFTEFKQFYDYNNNKLPFGIAQVGKSYRNEIAGKQFVRLREFTQAEIEYFYNPYDDAIPYAVLYPHKKCFVLTAARQMHNQAEEEITLNMLHLYIKNNILLEFAVKLYMFAETIGLDMNNIRFRQHKHDEMAHYSKDCWDLEAKIFNKWLEITGIADRGDYDLKTQDKNDIFKIKKHVNPIIKYRLKPRKTHIFKSYPKMRAIEIMDSLKQNIVLDTNEEAEKYDMELYEIEKFNFFEMIYPHVIEPSIGIDRVFYSLIVHNLRVRENTTRPFLLLTKETTPYDFMLAQLSNNTELVEKLGIYKKKLSKYNIFTDMSSTTIGKRYTRADEIGIIFSVTIDFETLEDDTVTIRVNKTMEQKRVHIDDIDKHI